MENDEVQLIAESVAHDEGVRCTSLDGHHQLSRALDTESENT